MGNIFVFLYTVFKTYGTNKRGFYILKGLILFQCSLIFILVLCQPSAFCMTLFQYLLQIEILKN